MYSIKHCQCQLILLCTIVLNCRALQYHHHNVAAAVCYGQESVISLFGRLASSMRQSSMYFLSITLVVVVKQIILAVSGPLVLLAAWAEYWWSRKLSKLRNSSGRTQQLNSTPAWMKWGVRVNMILLVDERLSNEDWSEAKERWALAGCAQKRSRENIESCWFNERMLSIKSFKSG